MKNSASTGNDPTMPEDLHKNHLNLNKFATPDDASHCVFWGASGGVKNAPAKEISFQENSQQ